MSWVDDTASAVAEPPPGEAPQVEPSVTPRRTPPSRWLSAWILLVAVGCFAALAAPALVGQVYLADDLGQFHLPIRGFYAEQLARGEPFDWMPTLFGGYYIAGEGQLGGYHPWHLLLYRVLPLGTAFNVELLASYPLLFVGMYVLLARLVGRRNAALFGALVFTFGGFNLLHFVHPNAIAIVAHLPWLLWAIDVALASTSVWRRSAAELCIGLLTASQLLLGYPQYVWFSLLAEVAFVAWRLGTNRAGARRLAGVATAISLGVAAGAIQWWPTWHVLEGSTRQTADAAFAATGSLHPLNLIQLLAPYALATRVVGQNTHELGLYVGAVPLMLCVWLLAHRDRWGRYRSLVWALLAFAVLALLLAAGEFGPLARLQALVPLVNRFRFPCRAIVLFQLAVAASAAVAAAILIVQRQPAVTRRGNRSMFAVVLASIAVAAGAPLLWPQFVAPALLVWVGPLLIGAAAVSIALLERGVRGAAVLLVLLAAADLLAYGLSDSVFGRTVRLSDFVAAAPHPPGDRDARVVVLHRPGGLRTGDRMLLAGVARVDGYAGLEPAKKLDYRRPRSWQLAGAGWVLHPADASRGTKMRWERIEHTAPRARLVTPTLGHEHPDNMELIGTGAAAVDQPFAMAPSPPGRVEVIVDRPGHFVAQTTAPTGQLLVTTESFDSGWQVTIDGHLGQVVRVDGDFLGCPIAAGVHHVQFSFQPRSRWLGMLTSACGLGLLVLMSCARPLCGRQRGLTNEEARCRDPASTRS